MLCAHFDSFNPRTRVGCDYSVSAIRFDIRVSIHAPVWGATRGQYNTDYWGMVSIHAPVWGATKYPPTAQRKLTFQSTHPCGVRLPLRSAKDDSHRGFNPRTRVGCDRPNTADFNALYVSIHAPVWGATHSLSWLNSP